MLLFFQPFLLEPKKTKKKTRKYLRVRSHSAVNFFLTIIPSAVIPQSKYIVKSYILLYRLIDTSFRSHAVKAVAVPACFRPQSSAVKKKSLPSRRFWIAALSFQLQASVAREHFSIDLNQKGGNYKFFQMYSFFDTFTKMCKKHTF